MQWAGGIAKKNFCVQGNILAGEEVVKAMAGAFESAKGDLGDRLIAALAAGQRAGGDKRGRQSAALLIVKEHGGYGGYNDRYRDIRVDDHPTPIKELARIYELHKRVFGARRGPRAVLGSVEHATLGLVKADLARIKSAATMFRLRENRYPKSTKELIAERGGLRYLASNQLPVDPWGKPYVLQQVDGRLVILSGGRDGKVGTADDITTQNMQSLKELPRVRRDRRP